MTSQAPSAGAGRAQRRPPQTLLRLAILPFLLLALLELRAPLDLSLGDQAQYVLHARSILAGRGYTDDGYIYTTRVEASPQAYPPGLPVVIAAVEGAGAPLVVVRLLMIASAALFLSLAGQYLATLDDPLLGPAAILLCGFIPNLALFASGIYSDFVFGATVWGCCLLVDRPGEWTRGRIAALTAVGALGLAFRTAAVAFIPALAVHQAWRTWRHGEPWRRALVPLAVWVATYLAIDLLLPVTQGYANQIVHGATPGASVLTLIAMLPRRAMAYQDFVAVIHFTPTPWRVVNFGYHAAALVALAIGAVRWVKRAGVRFLFCLTAFYVAIILVMPWAIARFLWPLAPMIWFATLDGARAVFQAMKVERVRAGEAAVLAGATMALVAVVLGPKPPALVGIGDMPQGRALYAVLRREAASMPVRAMLPNPRDAARLPGVSAMSVPPAKPDSLLAEADTYRITHVVVGSLGTDITADRAILQAVKAHPERFRRVYANEQFIVYRVMPARSLPVGDEAMRR